mgnify:CR=1 FL=1
MKQNETLGRPAAENARQFLTFLLAGEEYGLPILQVQEIKGYPAVTPLPNAPAYLRGMMNLRGTVVPVLDLRRKFHLAEAEPTRFTVIVLVTVAGRVVGLVVDAVADVLDVPTADLEAVPEIDAGIDTGFLSGLAKAGERLVLLLNVERVVGHEPLPCPTLA